MTHIGIVIPIYKARNFLARTLESIRAQTFGEWSAVLVDDGSPDDSAAIALEFTKCDPRFKLHRQKNAGVSKARDAGFALLDSRATHVTFMDSDDLYEPFALESLVCAMESDREAIGSHGLAETIDENDQPLTPGAFEKIGRFRLGYKDGQIILWPETSPTCFESLAFINPVFPPGLVLTRRDVYEKVGPWDPSLIVAQDWDMILRLARFGHFRFLPRVILRYRRHGNNASDNHATFNREAQLLYHKTFFAAENNTRQQKMLKEGWRAWQVYRAKNKAGALGTAMKTLSLKDAAKNSAHLFAHALRYARGYPTAGGL